MRFPILILRRVLNDLNHIKHQKCQELLDIEFFRPFTLKNLVSYLEVLDFDGMVCGKLYHNNQNENELKLYTFDQISSEVKFREVFKNSNIISLHNSFIKMFFKR